MAAGAPGQLLRDEARCPVCLDFLQEPVSVDCGHSFCLRCISEFCDKSDSAQGGLYACPQCRGPFAREGFRPNRQLASLVDGVRQLGLGAGPTGAQCARHGQELSRFCDDDQVALCWMCDTEPEHRGHRTAPLQEAARHHQEKVETQRQRFRLEFEKHRGFLAQEEQLQLRRLEQEERATLQILRDSKSRLAQHSRALRELADELEDRCQRPALGLLEGVRGVLSRSKSVTRLELETIPMELKTMCRIPGMREMLRKFQGAVQMDGANESAQENFILLGFSDRPHLEKILFVVILIAYLLTLVGNTTIILVCRLDPHLHSPMYFFLTHLSVLDLCFTTSSIPQLLYNLSGHDKTISYTGCAIQLFLFLALGGVECLLLAVMAYDRFVAVCKPLHYMVIMNPRLCVGLLSVAWGCGVANSMAMSPVTLHLPRCGCRSVDHFLCEMPALIRMACVDTAAVEGTVFVLAVGIVLLPLGFILISYGYIVRAVLQIQSAAGRHKAASTCSSHLTVVSLFYGNIIYMYMQPGNSSAQDQGKFLTLFYNIVTPLLNPLIYTLRNKDVKGALKRLLLSHREGRRE
ncbi:E3 ubiquitin-protein ligase TRIM58 isoform X3 [Rhinolophus sinicus]|uniref:E3 ubiquitin-protein ligase TRIM58 isoform X3 n=1 Tax=Rhinolophus sinicus TaxID=89399 RepID=UPI003D79DA8B